jgi:Bacterial RNA polymerase, alpha chain C terminal domain
MRAHDSSQEGFVRTHKCGQTTLPTLQESSAVTAPIVSLSELSDDPPPGKDGYGFSPQLEAVLTYLPKTAGCRVRVANALCNASVLTVTALCQKKRGDLKRWKNFGKRSLADLESTLAQFGLTFADDPKPIVVPEQGRPIDAHVQQLHRWIDESLARCETQERAQGELDAAAKVERRILTNVMLILDGQLPSMMPEGIVSQTQSRTKRARIHLSLQQPDGRRSEITNAFNVTPAMLEAAEDLLQTLTTGERPPPRGLYDLCVTAFGIPREEVKNRILAALYGTGKAASDAGRQRP